MKLHIYVLFLVGVSSHKCADSEWDVTSHLATRANITKLKKVEMQILISEFDLRFRQEEIEISGPSGDSFDGCVFAIDPIPRSVDYSLTARGTFDENGLLVVDLPRGPRAPVAYYLSKACPPSGEHPLDDVVRLSESIYDSIGVPLEQDDENSLQTLRDDMNALSAPENVPGTDLKYTGGEPDLVFRDDSRSDWYVVTAIDNGPIFDALGNRVEDGDFETNPLVSTFGAINPTLGASDIGDPHIHTLAGNHYTLLQEGSFLLWGFGLEKPKVQWQLYAHYAGRQSFTKGLLLVDTSGPQPSTMEITSERCEWQARGESNEWSLVTLDNEVVFSGPSSHMKLVSQQHKGIKQIDFFLVGEKKPVARLKVMCRQGRHINLKLHMANRKWAEFVGGEFKGEKESKESKKISTLQLDAKEDQEFQVKVSWKELGGSSHAEQYLQNLDENTSRPSALIQTCDSQAEAEARALCRKHLGENSSSAYFKECVFDVCSGAGEVAAEMAAEMLKF